MKNQSLKVLLSAGMVVFYTAVCHAVTIVKNGQPSADIVVAANASATVQDAAEELQHYIEKSTGAMLPIHATSGASVSIQLENVSALPGSPTLDPEGFILQGLDKSTFVIAGGGDRGIAFGVDEFLERYLGVRWLMPGEMGEDVPKHSTLDIPETKIQQEPVYLSRRLGGITDSTKDVDGMWTWHNRAVWREAHGHNLLNIFPPKDYAQTHPDFYPMLKGKRYIPKQGTWNWQPNFSAPGIVDEGAAQVEKYFQAHPDATTYSLAMNDAGSFDGSPQSLARRNGKKNSQNYEDISDDYYLWANAVAAKVLLQYPGKWFGTLAYRELTDPPKPEIGVNDHIIPFMTQERLRWIDPKLRAIDQANTEKWAAVAQHLGWYDYVYGMSYCIPREWPHLAQQYLSWGAAHHVKFYTSELYPNWGEGPKGWILAKLLWNPNQNVDDLLNDWYEHAAGPAAAPKLKAYYDIWEKFWTQDILHSKWWTGAGPYLPFTSYDYLADVPKSYVEQSDALLDEAYKLADTPERKYRIEKLRDVWQRYYKPSIVIYQDEQAAAKPIATEAQALAKVQEAAEEIKASQARQEFFHLLPTYKNDPFYHFVAMRGSKSIQWMGGDWGAGNSLLWNLLPWAEKSAAVQEKLQQLTSDTNPVVQQNVRILLAAAQGGGKPLLANSSFEDGINSWQVTQKTFDFPTTYNFGDAKLEKKSSLENAVQISEENSHSGKNSLLISSGHDGTKVLQQALISQDVPYVPGNYYLQAHFYQPKNSPMTYVIQQVQLLDANGKEIKNAPYVTTGKKINLTPGEWSTFRAPIVLPETKFPVAKMRVTLAVRALTVVPLGDWRVNEKTFVDDVNLYQLDKSTFKD
jgi:hypothetical protein